MAASSISASDIALKIDPLLGAIEAYAEILVAAGTSRCAEITPNSIMRIGSDILQAVQAAMAISTAPLQANQAGEA